MQNKPEIIKLLAQKMNTSPEWTGTSGVFRNAFSGYAGVEIFVGYVKHLKLANGNKIPEALPRKARDFVDYLNELPEDQKEKYSSYFQKTVPKFENMIRDAKMTKESILEFANIFNELGIGQNPMTIIADYQNAVSEAFKFKMQTAGGGGLAQAGAKDETYQQLILSDKEKADVIEKCRQQGTTISSSQLDNYYVGSGGTIYSGDGTAVTTLAVGAAISQTLQYQVGIGNAEKLNLTAIEITEILAVCKRKGIKMTKEDLENIYIDKDGQLYYGDGTMITDVSLGTEIKQTATYANAYEKFANKRGEKQVAAEIRDDKEEPEIVIPGALPDPLQPGALELPKQAEAQKMARERASETARAQSGLGSRVSEGTSPSRGLEGAPLIAGGMPEKNRLQIPNRIVRGRDGTRQRKGSRGKGRIPNQEAQSRTEGRSGTPDPQAQQAQAQRNITDAAMASQSVAPEEKGGVFGTTCKVGGGIGACYAGAKLTGIAATFFMPASVIDNHYFISTILKILFQ
jgi:hypothetical protein